MSAPAESDQVRPHCLNRDACAAKSLTKHCKGCAASARGNNPEYRQMMSDAKMRSFEADPRKLHRVKISASRGLKKWHAAINWTSFHGKRSDAYFSWCPPERRDEYRKLQKRFGAVEAKLIILDDIAHKARLEVRRNADAMLEKHRREVASRY